MANTNIHQAPESAMTPIEKGRLYRAQLNPDEWVARILYSDKAGSLTIRYISPTRIVEKKGYLRALCLSREEVRTFSLEGIRDVTLVAAHRIQMPVPAIAIPVAPPVPGLLSPSAG
jgi:hypothetical protein